MRQDIVAIIPAYRCSATIAEVVEGARRHLGTVVVVDDGSGDSTGEEARRAGAVVLTHERNRGKGAALRTGIEAALAGELPGSSLAAEMRSPDALALLDGDGQHDPDDLPFFLDAWDTGSWDLLVGARLSDRLSIPTHRYWTNRIGSRLLSFACGVDLEDSQSGYRLLDGDLARRMNLVSDGYAIESEMLIKASHRGARIGHVRVRTIYHDRVPSYYQPLSDTVRITLASVYHRLFDRVQLMTGMETGMEEVEPVAEELETVPLKARADAPEPEREGQGDDAETEGGDRGR